MEPSTKPIATQPVLNRHYFWFWHALVLLFFSLSITGVLVSLFNKQLSIEQAKNKRQPTAYLISAKLGGEAVHDQTGDLIRLMADLNPDNLMFIGHTLSDDNFIRYLSAKSRTANVQILLGSDEKGENELANVKNPMRNYSFSCLIAGKFHIASQLFIAINSKNHHAFAVYGSFPFGATKGTEIEYHSMLITDWNDCIRLYKTYAQLFPTYKPQT